MITAYRVISTTVVSIISALAGAFTGWVLAIWLGASPDTLAAWSAAGAALTALATFVLVIVTAMLWLVSDRSAMAAKKSADAATRAADIAATAAELAAETARRQMRAYVQVEGSQLHCDAGGQLTQYVVPGSRAIATVRVKNTGQTPARDVGIRSMIGIRDEPADAASFRYDEAPLLSRTDIGSNLGANSSAASPGIVSDEMFANIQSGAAAIYLFGEVAYYDVFGTPHVSRFRLRNASGRYDGTMTFCEEGNTSD